MKPYLIIAPDFTHICGGIVALHKLCHRLNEKGCEAYVTGVMAPKDNIYFNKCKHISMLSKDDLRRIQYEGVVVCPDVVAGNPLQIQNVARWWLATSQPCPPNEIVFSFTQTHNGDVPAEHTLCVVNVEEFFRLPEVEDRPFNCYRVHKGASVPRIPETSAPNCIEITGAFPPTRRELATLLQKSKIFYTYDNLTGISIEARLCGCVVKNIAYSCVSKERAARIPFSQYGEANPEEPLDYEKLKAELPLFRERFDVAMKQFDKELDDFIEITQRENRPYARNVVAQAPQRWLPIHLFEDRGE
jgi:hypothetical protein